jgi:flagellin-like hook-associated protein FlgL
MSDVTLSKGVRQNLLSLQNVATLLGQTQERLATGKRVNSALDNPINFFTSQGLQARAGDLSRLLDSMGNAIQSVQAADKGISSITKLLENAQAVANQAKQASSTATFALDIAGDVDVGDDVEGLFGTVTDLNGATVLGDLGLNNGQIITIDDGDDAEAYTIDVTETVADLVAALNAHDNISVTLVDGQIRIQQDDAAGAAFTIADDNGGTDVALIGFTQDQDSAGVNEFLHDENGTITFQLGSEVQTVDLASISSRADLEAALATASAGLTDVTLSVDGTTGFLTIASTSAENLTISQTGGALDALNGTGTATEDTHDPAVAGQESAERTSLQADFNLLLSQISDMAGDASFNGVNLLSGDNLTVTFNEDGSSTLTIEGVDFTATGLSLTAATGDDFQTDANINAALAELDGALSTLRTQAARFGSNLSIVQTRQDFTNNMINVLQIGADQLVLADTNEEGANMLALNTRQQLSTVALSLAAQADQNVLRLF